MAPPSSPEKVPERRVVGILGVIPDVGALQGREHGVPAVADVVAFHEDRAAHRGARAVLGDAVVVVVVNVRRVEAHAGVARVAVVEPVMVVVDVVPGGGVLAQAQQARLSVVPEVVVVDGHVGRKLDVHGAVALDLVRGAPGHAVEVVVVVDPDVVVGLLQADVVARGAVDVHDPEIADLKVRCVLDAHAPTVRGGVVAHALEGHVAGREIFVCEKDVAVLRGCGTRHLPNHPDDERTAVFALCKGVEDGLDAHAGIGIGAGDGHGDGVLGLLGKIENDGAGHGGAVEVVGAGNISAGECESRAVVGGDGQRAVTAAVPSLPETTGTTFKGIASGLEADRVGPPVGAVGADQGIVELLVDEPLAVNVNVVAVGLAARLPLDQGPPRTNRRLA
jgi:hypothetical protein